jgi:hypothetical protein
MFHSVYAALAASSITLVTAGCSTPYQEMSFKGGVAAQQISADTYRIISRGNGYTGKTAVQDYTLLKAAETTKAAGATHFIVVSSADASRRELGQTAGTLNTHVIGSTAYSTYNPGYIYEIAKPGEDTYIRVLTLHPGHTIPGAYSADEIITFVGSRVRRPSS